MNKLFGISYGSCFSTVFFTLIVFLTQTEYCEGNVRRIDTKDGLTNNEVTSFFQDDKGFMWIGTYDGLNRYDGNKFVTFRHDLSKANSLINNRVLSITADKRHNLYIGTESGISLYDPRTSVFKSLALQSQLDMKGRLIRGKINLIKEISPNQIAIASEIEGFLITEPGHELARSIPLKKNNTFQYNYNASSIAIDRYQKVWVMVNGVGLCVYDRVRKLLIPLLTEVKYGNCLIADGSGSLWIATDNGLYQYNAQRVLSRKIPNLKINHLYLNKNGELWISTDGKGILINSLGSNQLRPYSTNSQNRSLENPVIYSVFQDLENRVWIGTLRSGIILIDPNKLLFKNYSQVLDNKTNPNADFILSLCKDNSGNLWVGTDGNGIRLWNSTLSQFRYLKNIPGNLNSLSSNAVTDIKADKKNNIWINTWGGTLDSYNTSSGKFRHYTLVNTKTKTIDRFGWRIYIDNAGTVWASTYNGGLYRLNTKSDNFELFLPALKSILSFSESKDGEFWVGNRNSLIKINPASKKYISYSIGYSVRSIHHQQNGLLWIGTEGGGLLLFNKINKRFTRFSDKDGLANNSILNILEDKAGYLWLSTYGGLSRIHPASHKINNYSQSDGLQSNQFNYNAALVFSHHEFIFGSIKGFESFNPLLADSSSFNKSPFKVNLEAVSVSNGKPDAYLNYSEKNKSAYLLSLTVPYHKANISMEFSLPEFSSSDKIQYAYSLKGLDKVWKVSNNFKIANYSQLPSGQYKFLVKTTDRQGNWGTPVNLLDITVSPPWYATYWAISVYAICFIIIGIFYSKYKAGKRRIEYNIQVALREKAHEKDLNEKRLSFFTSISHEFRTPLTLILNPLKEILTQKSNDQESDAINIAYKNAKRLHNLVDQLLLVRKSEEHFDELDITRVNVKELCSELYSYFIQEARQKHIQYDLICDDQNCEASIDRGKLEIAIVNVLANAFKFTPVGGTISLRLDIRENEFFIEISDTGIGIDENIGEKLFENFFQIPFTQTRKTLGFGIGLFLARKIIFQHQGSISYTSKPAEGTRFFILIPFGKPAIKISSNLNVPAISREFFSAENEDNNDSLHQEQVPNISISDKKSILVIDDNKEIRAYIMSIFKQERIVYEAQDGISGLQMVRQYMPNLIISDLLMPGLTGLDLCRQIKADSGISHIPIVLLTGNNTEENMLAGINSGAVDYIVKPFDKALLLAKVNSLLLNNNQLQQYFLETITLKQSLLKVPVEFKEFLENCIEIIEANIDNENFNVLKLSREMGMSHSALYKKVKAISGLTISTFIRSIRLRKAAELMIRHNHNVNQASFHVGIADVKYFRLHFFNLFGMQPSAYIRQYRSSFQAQHTVVK